MPTVTAKRQADFLDALGANTHMSYGAFAPYTSAASMISMLQYCGIGIIRENINGFVTPLMTTILASIPSLKWNVLALEDFSSSPAVVTLSTDVTNMVNWAASHPGSIYSYEGPNEYATNNYTYNGQLSSNNPSWGQQMQAAIFNAVRAQPSLNSVLLVAPSLAWPEGSGPYGFNFGSTANIGNCHGGYSSPAGAQIAPNLNASYSVDSQATPGLPIWVTETGGASTWGWPWGAFGTQQAQGVALLNSWLESWRIGFSKAFIYQLADSNIFGDNSDTMGIFDINANPKLAATYIKNQRALLADNGAAARTFTPGSLTYTLTNMPNTAASVLLAKSDATTYSLVLYNPNATIVNSSTGAYSPPAPQSVSVSFSSAVASFAVYDPTVGTTALQTGTNTSAVTVSLGASPVIIQVQATQVVTGPPLANIFVGISAWAPSTTYSVGNRRSNSTNAYQCTKAGTSASSGGPTGTGSSITDGSATWTYLGHVDYVTVGSWASGIPATLTQPIVGTIWDCGAITTTAGTAYLNLSGHTTSSTNTITLKAAAGDSIRDIVAAGNPLVLSPNAGVRFILPSGVGNINYFVISDSNVIFDGLQFQDPNAASNSSIIATRQPGSLTIKNSVFDGYTQTGGASIFDIAAPLAIENCLIVERQLGGTSATTVGLYAGASGSKVVNTTFAAVLGPIANAGAIGSATSGCYVRNCVFVGYSTPNATGSVNIAFDHSATDATSFGSFTTDNGGNIFSIVPANQFVGGVSGPTQGGFSSGFSSGFGGGGTSIPSSDFRVKTGASIIPIGIADAADIPTVDDIARQKRTSWTPGAWEYSNPGRTTGTLSVRASGIAALTAPVNSARGNGTLEGMRASVSLSQRNRANGTVRLYSMFAVVAATQSNGSTGTSRPWSSGFSSGFGPSTAGITVNLIALIPGINPVGTAALTQNTTCLSAISFSATGSISTAAIGAPTFMQLSALAIATQLGMTANILTLSCLSSATPLLNFVGAANIDWRPIIAPLSSSTSATARATVFRLQSSSTVTPRNLLSASVALLGLSVSSAVGSSCSALANVITLSASASAAPFESASGLSTLAVLTVGRPSPTLIESDAAPPLWLLADGSGLLIAADVLQPNITSTAFASGGATIDVLSCVARSLLQTFCSGTESLTIAASAQTQQFTRASGLAPILPLSGLGIAVQKGAFSGLASLEQIAATGLLSQVDAVSGLAYMPAISAIASVNSFTGASTASFVLPIAASAFAGIGQVMLARASLLGVSATGTASFALGLSAASSIMLSASALVAQNSQAVGSTSVAQVSSSSVATQSISAAGSGTVIAIGCNAGASLRVVSSGIDSIASIAAFGSAINAVDQAQAVASIAPLSAAGAAAVFGSLMAGQAFINFSGGGTIISEIEAAVLVELEQIVTTHAKLWITPTGYEQGDLVVYWND